MEEKVPKKMNLKEIGIEKIILIAIAGIVLLLANFSEWKNAISEKTEKKEEKTVQTDQNDAYVSALENKLVHILENVDGVGRVEVMITLKSSKESVLNKDRKRGRRNRKKTAIRKKQIRTRKGRKRRFFRIVWGILLPML